MKKLFIILFSLFSLLGFGQNKPIFFVPNSSSQFGRALPDSSLVYDKAGNKIYRINVTASNTSTLNSIAKTEVTSQMGGIGTVPATNVTVDNTNYTNVNATNAQTGFNELERLFGIVQRLSTNIDARSFPLNTFTGSVTITSSNFSDFFRHNNLYVRNTDARVNFLLPLESAITEYPAVFVVSNLGGTARFDSGIAPTNTVVIDTQAGDASVIRRTTATGTIVNFEEAHRGDVVEITKSGAGAPWVVVSSSTDPRSQLLPNGVFNLNSRMISFSGTNIRGLDLYTPIQGDAFEVTNSTDAFGFTVSAKDVLVALKDSPNLSVSSSNEDWLRLSNASNFPLTTDEIRFLAQVTESTQKKYTKVLFTNSITNTDFWISPYALDHDPFVNPSTDPNNPQSGQTVEYIGGDEQKLNGNDFKSDSLRIHNILYFGITGPTTVDDRLYIEYRDTDSTLIKRYKLSDDFRTIDIDPGNVNPTYRHFVLNINQGSDNLSEINYYPGQTLNAVISEDVRGYGLSDQINATSNVSNLSRSQLSTTAQALINNEGDLSGDQVAKLNGLETTTSPGTIDNSFIIYVKDIDPSPSNDLSEYTQVSQGSGIRPSFGSTRPIVFLVEKGISVNGLQLVSNTATKLSAIRLGELLGMQAYTAVLPSVTGTNTPLNNAWQIDGTNNNFVLSGANQTFKIDPNNLTDDIRSRIFGTNPISPSSLPDNLQTLSHDLTVTTRTATNWITVSPTPITSTLTRAVAVLWDFNPHTTALTDFNEFTDLAKVTVSGFDVGREFYYSNPSDPLNRNFPGAKSYIYEDNIRIRNASGSTPLTTSFRKIVAFDYALEANYNGSVADVLRIGPAGTEPLLKLDGESGLVVRVARPGTTQTRTVNQSLQVDNSHWSTRVGVTTNENAEIIIPDGLTGSFSFSVSMRRNNNDTDEGTHTENFTITNVDSDQSLGSKTFTYGIHNISVTFNYDADNTDLTIPRDIVTMSATLDNAAISYDISATHSVTESWSTSTTYADVAVNAGSAFDEHGFYNPERYTTRTVGETNRIVLMTFKANENDNDSDPEIAVRIIVDGEREGDSGDSYTIRTNRRASTFDFTDWNFGNSVSSTSRIQIYNYDPANVPSEDDLLILYNGHPWLGYFRHPSTATDIFKVNGGIEFNQVIGGKTINCKVQSDGSTGYEWNFTEETP